MIMTYVYSGGTETSPLSLAFAVFVAVVLLAGWMVILGKAGYSQWLALLWLIPLVNVVAFFVFAFSEWPVVKEARATRRAYDLYKRNVDRQRVGPS